VGYATRLPENAKSQSIRFYIITVCLQSGGGTYFQKVSVNPILSNHCVNAPLSYLTNQTVSVNPILSNHCVMNGIICSLLIGSQSIRFYLITVCATRQTWGAEFVVSVNPILSNHCVKFKNFNSNDESSQSIRFYLITV